MSKKKKAATKKPRKRKAPLRAKAPKAEPQQAKRKAAYMTAWDTSIAGVSEEWAEAMRRNHERGLHDERPGEGCPLCAGTPEDAA